MFIRPWLDALKSRWMPGNRSSHRRAAEQKPVQSQVESLEDRSLLSAFDLITVIPNQGVFLSDGQKLTEAPREVTLRFSPGQTINPTSLGAVTIVRAGVDGIFDNPLTPALESSDDVTVTKGYAGLGELPNEVIVRFANTLVDDKYQIRIDAAGPAPIAAVSGDPFNGGVNKVFNFELDLGAQVEAVVPQPVIRSTVFSTTGLANLTDGDLVTISAGANTYRFEINLLPNAATSSGNTRVDIAAGSSPSQIADALVAAINTASNGQLTATNGGSNTITVAGAAFEPVVAFSTTKIEAFAKSYLTIANAAAVTDGDVIRVTLNNTLYRFELNQLPNNIVGIGNIRVNYNAGDSAATIAGNLATAINGLALNTPTVQLRATVVGNSIALTAIPALGTPSVAVSSTNAAAFSQVIGTLAQATDKVVVYFNQDQLNNVSANDPKFYQLLVNGQILLPSNVNYTWNSQNGLSVAVLTFAAPLPNGTYSLKVGVSSEPNNSTATAVQVGNVFNNQTFSTNAYLGDGTGSSIDSSDLDLYQFSTSGAGQVQLTVNPAASLDAIVELLDSNGAVIGAAVNGAGPGGQEVLFNAAVPAGTYYARVSSANGTGGYQLQIQTNQVSGNSDDNSSFNTATSLGTLGTGGLSTAAQIQSQGAFVTMPQLPGGSDEPGHRDLPLGPFPQSAEPGHATGIDGAPAAPIPTAEQTYSFPATYDGSAANLASDLKNQITAEQKEIVRQIFAIYGNLAGIQFREVASGGDQQIVVGDIRANAPALAANAVGGISGSPLIINAIFYGTDNTYGGGFTTTAFHEIGHNLGLGHSYDVPSIQGSSGNQENTFIGDNDLIHLLRLFPNNSSDIDLYQFNVTQAGTLSAQTIAERLGVTNLLDSALSLYRQEPSGARTLIARNDDYYSKDAGLEIALTPGTYFIGVTASGNDNFDPTISNSGFGGRSQGAYQLKLDFKPAATGGSGLTDTTGQLLDGDHDGKAGGEYDFSFVVAPTIIVDKLAPAGGNGSLAAPYNTISAGLAAAAAGSVVRIVGNGGADGDASTLADNVPYAIGLDYNVAKTPLADGATFQVPKGVTVVIDSGTLIKLHGQTIDVGSSSAGIDRSGGALQVLGTPINNVTLTSWRDDAKGSIDDGVNGNAAGADWGGIVIRKDSDSALPGVFLNTVNHATIQYGGGSVSVDGGAAQIYNAIDIRTARPTITNNTITNNADAAISANPDSFKADDGRIGPDIHGNLVTQNSTNGLFVRVQTALGSSFETLNVIARFDDTDITHVITQNLILNGRPGGALSAPISARLQIDPGTVVKLSGARIETGIGSSNLIAEGTAQDPIRFTSQQDDRYGAGGTFDLKNDLNTTPVAGNWSGIFVGQTSTASLDYTSITYAGGGSEISGNTDNFNPVATLQGNLRVTNSLFENNAGGLASTGRGGRGSNDNSTIFVRGAQPVLVNNIFRDNVGNVISINANSLVDVVKPDYGRSTGPINRFTQFDDNYGPLVRLNKFANSTTFTGASTLGMNVRAEELTTESVWDDTDIAHVVRGTISSNEFHTYGGLRLQSSATGSLVVKLQGAQAGFVATGDPLEISDRIGGSVQVVGQPGFPVILTSLRDDGVSAGFKPNGFPQFDTNGDNNAGGATAGAPGDWNSLSFDQYSNDRNVAIVLESEAALTRGNDLNSTVTNPQALGNLAPNQVSGDENRRLGFEVHGFISPDSPGDVDVYSFTANPGTEVWVDTDFTSQRLDVMVELLNSAGVVLARSLNSQAEQANPAAWLASGLAGTLAGTVGNSDLNTLTKDPTLGVDFYTSNFHDAGFRAVLPGTGTEPITYFVRVRSQPAAGQEAAAIPAAGNGLTSGAYQLQVRLKQVDEIPGSTVRYADIRYATNGIELHGLPAHSPLMGEAAEQNGDNDGTNGAQYLGPLLQTDRNTLSVAGSLASSTDVDFYRFTVDYSQIQVISGGSDGGKFFPTMFDIDWADGLTRPDTSIAVYNSLGSLIYFGSASDLADDQGRPGFGQDLTDLSRGSVGTKDPTIGTVNLPAGVNGVAEAGGVITTPPTGLTTYYVAVFGNGMMPTALTAVFNGAATPENQRVRLEPVNSITRVVEDHVGFTGYSSQGVTIEPTNGPLFNVTTSISLQTNIRPFTLSDVNLFVTTQSSLFVVDPFNGTTEIDYANYGNTTYQDIDMRSDGRLWAVRSAPGAAQNGALVELDTGTAGELSAVSDGIGDVDTDGATQRFQSNNAASTALAFRRNGVGSFDVVFYATADQDDYPSSPGLGGVSKLYRGSAATGSAAWSANNLGASGIITDFAGTVTTRTTGLQMLNGTLWGVSAGNQLYPISQQNSIPGDGGTNVGNPDPANPALNAALTPRLINGTVFDFSAVLPVGSGQFSGVTDAPQNVESQAYANLLFIITTTGRIFAVDPNAADAASALMTVFDNDNDNIAESTFVDTNVGAATGLAFSPVDYNLWHPTATRGNDAGHGINSTQGTTAVPNVDNSRTPTLESTSGIQFGNESLAGGNTEALGGASMYFGIENFDAASTANYFRYGSSGQYGVLSSVSQQDLTTNANIRNNYNVPGGTAGSLVTNSFSLEGYTGSDKPTLYFNYFLNTENANGKTSNSMRDSARVYVSVDDGQTWTLAATNNSVLSNSTFADAELPAYLSRDRNASTKVNQGVQELYETSSWRQARIDLNDFVGSPSVKLRFDFSTSGRTGTVIDPLTGLQIPSNDTSNPTFVNDRGSAFGVTAGGGNSPLSAQNNTAEGFYVDDIIVGFASRGEMVTNSSGQGSTFTNLLTDPFATTTPQGGAAQRTFDPDPTSTQQLLTGDYQLEIRRGNEYGSLVSPVRNNVFVNPTLDINDRLTNGQTIMVGNNVQPGNTVTIYDGLITRTFEFTAGGAPSAGNIAVNITGLNPFTQKGTIASRLANQINTTFNGRNTVFAKAVGAAVNSDRVDLFGAISASALIASNPVSTLIPAQVEDNDTIATATNTLITGASNGTFTGTGQIGDGSNGLRDVDLFSIQLQAGQTFTVETDLPTGGDSILRIFDATGIALDVSDDAPGSAPEFTSLESFLSFTAPLAGTYYIGVSGYSNFTYNPTAAGSGTNSNSAFNYTLNISIGTPIVGLAVQSYVRQGDDNLERQAGQFIIENNTILYAGNDGILIDDDDRFGTVPHPGAPLNTPVSNTQGLVTGIYIQNNVIARFQDNGIEITGDPNPNLGRAITPFVKIVNNTIYGDDVSTTPGSGLADVIFLIDNSGSMGPDIAILVSQLLTFDSALQNANISARYGLVQFPRQFTDAPQQTQDITDFATFTAPNSPFQNITITGATENGAQAIREGLNDFDPSTTFTFTPGAKKVLVMLTNEDDDSPAADRIAAAADLLANNATFFCIGDPTFVNTSADYGPLATATGGSLLDLTQFETNTTAFFTAFISAVTGVIQVGGATGTGIRVSNNASPTIMNNVIANTQTGITVDASSSTTEVEANLYSGNVSDGVLGINALAGADTTGKPMFVNPSANNFYPAPFSPIVDSSRTTFNDRAGYSAVAGALGIPKSPILAPTLDRFGQLRVDDDNSPGPANQPGLGQNPFQDRGAIERADFTGGTVIPVAPQDNDGAGVDLDGTQNVIWVDSQTPGAEFNILTELKLQLVDAGIGIDDGTVDATDFLLLQNGTPLVEGQDYFFTYNQNTNEAIFTSVATFALDSRYQIVINSVGISDLAGNLLQNNQSTPITPANPQIQTPFDSSLLYFTYVVTDGKNDGPVTSLGGVPAPVTPQTAPPVVINEDSSVTFSTTGVGRITVSDQDAFLAPDGDPNTGAQGGRIRVTISIPNGFGSLALAANSTTNLIANGGAFSSSGTPIFQYVLDGRIDDINTALDGLVFTPLADFPIGLPAQTVNVTVLTEDLGKFGPPAPGNTDPKSTTTVIPVVINPVNDLPTLTVATATPITILEDKVTPTQIDLTNVVAGGGENQALQITVTSSNQTLISDANIFVNYANGVLPAPTTGNIQFTAAPNRFGTAILTVTLTDAGLDNTLGTADDGITTRNITVNVTPVNDRPTIDQPTNTTILEDVVSQTIVLTGIGYGQFEFPGQTLTLTAVSSDPTIISNPTISYNQGDSTAILTYAPNANRNGGPVTITITARDDGGILNGGVDTTVTSFQVTVVPVNDPPTVTVPANLTIREDDASNPQQIVLTGVTAGPFEGTQTITSISITSSNQSLIPDANIVQGILSGTSLPVTITPLANQFGTAVITVTLVDNGINGGANGDINFITKTFTITVLSVNDAPHFDTVPPQTILEDAPAQTITLANLTAGPANESSQQLVLSAVSLDTTLIANPLVVGQNTITYTPVANANGVAIIRVTLRDNGGTANGGSDTYTQDITVNITAVNDRPTLDPIANQPVTGILLEDSGQQTINLTGITAGPNNENTQSLTVTAAVTAGNLNLAGNFIGSVVAANGTATLKYTPTPNEFGTATITVTITDSGANGGGNGDVNFFTRTFTLTVTPVNDPPKVDAILDQTVNEDAGQQSIALTGLSVGQPNEAPPQTLSFTLSSDNPALIPNDSGHLSVAYTQGNSIGQLLYSALPNGFGVANITLTIKDTGGTTNGGNDTIVRTFKITVNQVPDIPSDIALAGNQVFENLPAGSAVGTLSTSDVDLPDDNFTYSVVGGSGLGFFQIQGNQLQTSQPLDFESVSSYSVTIRSTDRFGLILDKTFNVAVVNLNDAPTLNVISPIVMLEDPTTPQLVSLTGISAGAGESQNVTITATSDNPSLFNNPLPVNYTSPGTIGTLSLSPRLNAHGTAIITVTVRDNGGTANGGIDTFTRTFMVTVLPVNDSPSDITLSNDTIPEIVAGTPLPAHVPVGQLGSIDPDNPAAGDTFSYALVNGNGGTDNDRFEIINDQLFAKGPIDFDTQANYSIRVRSTDTGVPSQFLDKVLTIHATNLNEPATGIGTGPNAVSGIPNSIPENLPANSIVGVLVAADPDAGDISTFTLVSGAGSTDNALFRIVSGNLISNVSFDKEIKSSYSIRIRAVDSQGLVFETPVTITVTNVNEIPLQLNLSNTTVPEDLSVGATVGTLSTLDVDNPELFTYSLVGGTGSGDNARFTINQDKLVLAAPLNFEERLSRSYSVRVRVTDIGGLSIERVFTIDVTDVNEAPVNLTLTPTSVKENQAVGTVVGTLTPIDPDLTDVYTYQFVNITGVTDNAAFQLSGNKLITAVKLDFESKSAYTVRVRGTDLAGHTIEREFTITVVDTLDPPVISLADSTLTTSGRKSVVVDPGATITDNDSTNFGGAKLRVFIEAGEQTGDVLGFLNEKGNRATGLKTAKGKSVIRMGSTEIASISGGVRGIPLEIRFRTGVTLDQVQKVMQRITFRGKPFAAPRQIGMEVTDETGNVSNKEIRNINVN